MDSPLVNPFNGDVFSPRYYQLQEESRHLPIFNFKDIFSSSFSSSSLIIINDFSSSGASSLIPQWSVELIKGDGKLKGKLVASALPRRLAALSLASRVAEEMDLELGKEVGFAIRDEKKGGSLLKFCTDGWLLREMEKDPLIFDFGVIIVDSIHERTLHIDVLISKLKYLLTPRKDLKVILIGSHLNINNWSTYFNHFSLISVPRPPLPEIVHSPLPSLNPVDAAVETVVGLEKEGNILLYLATKEEVEKTCEEIGRRVEGLACIPLHSGLSFHQLQQLNSIEGRKCIVSTSIGDSSAFLFNINVSFVIDGGRIQSDFYDDEESLNPISKMTANRRIERIGVKKVIRIYSEKEFEEMEEETIPVIQRMNPKRVKEVLKDSGIDVDSNRRRSKTIPFMLICHDK